MLCKLSFSSCATIETHIYANIIHVLIVPFSPVRLRKIVQKGGWILIRFLLSKLHSTSSYPTYGNLRLEARARPADNTIVRVRVHRMRLLSTTDRLRSEIAHCNHVTREKSLGSGDSCLVPLPRALKHSSFRSSRRSLFSRVPAAGSL